MGLGDSGGRSAGNRTGEGARRRNTPRERAQIDPPLDQMTEVVVKPVPAAEYRLTPRGERLLMLVTALSIIGMVVLALVLFYSWWLTG